MSTRELRMVWHEKQSRVMLSAARLLDVEGALRSGKTTVCLWKEFRFAVTHPGIAILIARWTDEGTYGLLRPLWDGICDAAGQKQVWNARESCYDWMNGSRIYMRGLMASTDTMRYSKFRGLTLARVYVDQAEEMQRDVFLELGARLSQKGFPQQMTISPQSVDEGHWINTEFPAEAELPGREYIPMSTYDNAHNLDPEYIVELEQLFPGEHPKHRTLVLGLRGMNVTGDPVYDGAFIRELHEKPAAFTPGVPVEVGIDFGKKHPCVVFRQQTVLGQFRVLGGIMGQDLYLADFVGIVKKHMASWFPDATFRWAGDPAGSADTSHGTKGAGFILANDHGIVVTFKKSANSPQTRLGIIERLADLMRRRLSDGSEAFVVTNDRKRWLRVSRRGGVAHRFLADALQTGYVWDEHMISVHNRQVKRPKKDGWYEHGCNCLEYLGVTFDLGPRGDDKIRPLQRTIDPLRRAYLQRAEAGWMNA